MTKVRMLQTLKGWSQQGLIRAVDYQFAKLLTDKSDEPLPEALILLSALVSHEVSSGNVCLPLHFLFKPEQRWPDAIVEAITPFDWLALDLFQPVLGAGEPATPLVLDQNRVYLFRYWRYEVNVATEIRNRACSSDTDLALLKTGLDQLFPALPDNPDVDWQKVAAAMAVQKRFAVISGGPGTGKTTTVIKLLVLYLQQMLAQGKPPQVRLAAPTGKAAARLSESISRAKTQLALPAELLDRIPSEATTLHRLLGVIPDSIQFRHDTNNPLHLDMLILDEASMVDLPMMARLLAALPSDTRMVLLGDRDQLASVEAGSVLGDMCSWPGELLYSHSQTQQLQALQCLPAGAESDPQASIVANSICLLRKSYRFDQNSGIGHVARAVNQGDSEQFSKVIAQGFSDVDVITLNRESYEDMIRTAVSVYVEMFSAIQQGTAKEDILRQLTEFQVLCALREGPYGVEGINERIQEGLKSRGWVPADRTWYVGRPVMIRQNDSALNLYNGDIGITLPDEQGRLKVWFLQNEVLCSYLPSRLPELDTVFAMTIHKSQGSEFTQIVLLLPADDVPVLCRELVYTAITRAKQGLRIYAPANVLKLAIERKTHRAGGLVSRLWNT